MSSGPKIGQADRFFSQDGWLAEYATSRDPELAVAQSRQELSLDRPVGDDAEVTVGDLLAAPGPREALEDLRLLPRLIAALPDRERTVIVLWFFHDLDQNAIAAKVGYSQMHVSRLLRRALDRMRAQLIDP